MWFPQFVNVSFLPIFKEQWMSSYNFVLAIFLIYFRNTSNSLDRDIPRAHCHKLRLEHRLPLKKFTFYIYFVIIIWKQGPVWAHLVFGGAALKLLTKRIRGDKIFTVGSCPIESLAVLHRERFSFINQGRRRGEGGKCCKYIIQFSMVV